MKRQQPGDRITDNEEIEKIRDKANSLIKILRNRNSNEKISIIDFDLLNKEELLEVSYYMVFNRWVRKGRKKIDLREYYTTTKERIINYLTDNFVLGYEFELIVFPKDDRLKYAFYVQGSIYWIDTNGIDYK
jgi:hypothetical protein